MGVRKQAFKRGWAGSRANVGTWWHDDAVGDDDMMGRDVFDTAEITTISDKLWGRRQGCG